MVVCALYHLKGGVGKTTAAVNIAYLASRSIGPTLLCDLDPQGAASYLLRADARKISAKKLIKGDRIDRYIVDSAYKNLFMLPASPSYRELDIRFDRRNHPKRGLANTLRSFHNRFEVLVIDSPPSISLQADNIFHIADFLFVPTIPSPLPLDSFAQIRHKIEKKKRRKPRTIGFYSLVDRRKKMHREIVDAKSRGEDSFFRSYIPYSAKVEEMSARRAPIFTYANATPPARAFRSLWEEMRSYLVPER